MVRSILVASLLLFSSSCQILGPDDPGTGRVEVHLQSSFDETPVVVVLDARFIYDGIATTDHRVGLADVVETTTSLGVHNLQVVVDGQFFSNRSIFVGPEIFVGVRFDGSEVEVEIKPERFVYF